MRTVDVENQAILKEVPSLYQNIHCTLSIPAFNDASCEKDGAKSVLDCNGLSAKPSNHVKFRSAFQRTRPSTSQDYQDLA